MSTFFVDDLLDDLAVTYSEIKAAMGLPDDAFVGRPRLEAVLDVIDRAHGSAALSHLTSNFTDRHPNRVHRMLAAHLEAGGTQITANFDRFIEHATRAGTSAPHHFHGEVETSMDDLPFGARLQAIEHGFSETLRDEFLSSITAPATRVVAWIGYSFSDYFDATPAVLEAINTGKLDDKTILWLQHSPDEPAVHSLPAELPTVIDAAQLRGVPVVHIVGRSGDALFVLLAEIGCSMNVAWAHGEHCDGSDYPVRPVYSTTDESKLVATTLLLTRFGILGRIEKLGISVDDLPHEAAAEYWWKRGEYRRARSAALAAIDEGDAWASVRQLLVHARFDWIEGRLVRAGRSTLAALRLLDDPNPAPLDLVASALERYGRVAVHMRRVPDARFLALPSLLRRLPDYENRVAVFLARSRDVDGTVESHVRDALHNFRVEVMRNDDTLAGGAVPGEARHSLIERFSQSEALDSYVDYIRGNANIGIWGFEHGAADWQLPMEELYRIIGNTADIHRMTLFQPGRSAATGRHRPLMAARSLDASNWHRIRMIAKHYVTRLRLRLRGN